MDIERGYVSVNQLFLRVIPDLSSNAPTPDGKAQQILAIAPILKGQQSTQKFSVPAPYYEATHVPNSTSQPPIGSADLIDFRQGAPVPAQQMAPKQARQSDNAPPGLQEPQNSDLNQPLKRQDTATDEVDEFVDADDGR